MNIVTQLQELDALIIENTTSPVTAKLRNKLSIAIEQAEAHADAVSRQDNTLSRQAQAIADLQEENKKLVATIAQFEAGQKQAVSDTISQQRTAAAALYDPDNLYQSDG
jgi:hypothetical protein